MLRFVPLMVLFAACILAAGDSNHSQGILYTCKEARLPHGISQAISPCSLQAQTHIQTLSKTQCPTLHACPGLQKCHVRQGNTGPYF